MHSNVAALSNTIKKLPKTIAYYNETKFGVNILYDLARKGSSIVPPKRWPLQVFYKLLDFTGVNRYIIYKEVTTVKISRREYIQKLIEEHSKNDAEPLCNEIVTKFF
uniref:PiggyBac transposable elementderived protein 4like [Megachile rotundata] n=1 Tax=Lepeophtheirus salmonis TaxID=72036 RepID=A0A0K2TMX2_LEPSM